ncbi:hypothetical protein GEMRC1_004635 [Eukaryota sp. GEM-RC1]
MAFSPKARVSIYGPLINIFVTGFCWLMYSSKHSPSQSILPLETIVSPSPEVYVYMISTFLSGVVMSDSTLRMHRILRRRYMGISSPHRLLSLFGNAQTLLFSLVYMGASSNLILPLSVAFLVGPFQYRVWYAFCMINYILAGAIELFVVTVTLWGVHFISKQQATSSPSHLASLITKTWLAAIFYSSVATFMTSSFYTQASGTAALSQYLNLFALWMFRGSYCVELDKE